MECFYSNNNGNLLVKKNIFTDINIETHMYEHN